MPHVAVNNVKFHYSILGKGQTELVFISGYTGDINLWKNVAESLDTDCKILLFDPQGSGDTQDENTSLFVEMMAGNVHQLYLTLGFTKPVLIGFALGASIALSIAHRYPDHLSGSVLVAGVTYFNEQAKLWCEQLCCYRETGTARAFQKMANLLYNVGFSQQFKLSKPKEQFITELLPILPTAQQPLGQRRQVEALKQYDASAWVNQVPGGTSHLVISPAEDHFSTSTDCHQLADALKAKLETVLNSGHAILIEQPNKISALIRQHLFDIKSLSHKE